MLQTRVFFKRTIPDAPAPTKSRDSDAGYDLTLVRKVKDEQNGLFTVWDTGIAVDPAENCYFELVGRSSISKTGYMVANNIGIIDNGYRGSIMVGLVKVRPECPSIDELENKKLVQIIPRQLIQVDFEEVDTLSGTSRGETGGLGSGQFK